MLNAHFGVNFTNKNNCNFTFDYLPQFITFHVQNHNTRFGVNSPYSLLCNSVNKSIETLIRVTSRLYYQISYSNHMYNDGSPGENGSSQPSTELSDKI